MLKANTIEAIIIDIEKNYPSFLRPKDLIKTGLFKSRSDVSWAIRRGYAPPSIKLSDHKVIFPRVSLCLWLRENANLSGKEE